MAPSLVFITQTGPNKSKATSTTIRKHVMKDIGISRRKQKCNPRLDLEVLPSIEEKARFPIKAKSAHLDARIPTIPSCGGLLAHQEIDLPILSNSSRIPLETSSNQPLNGSIDQQQSRAEVLYAVDRLWTGRIDPFVIWPVDMNDKTRMLIDRAFDDRYINVAPFRDACFPVSLMGPAAFHQVLSNALLNIACSRDAAIDPSTCYDSLYHHAIAIKLINKGIADEKHAKSDEFIGAVIGFACYHSYTGNQAAWRTHLNGVEEIIRLRGGVETLDNNRLVRILLGWSDVNGSCIEDAPPRFPLASQLVPEIDSLLPCLAITLQADDNLATWLHRFPSQVPLLSIMADMLRFNSHLQREIIRTDRKILKNGEFSTGFIYPLLHRLLSYAGKTMSADPSEEHVLQACRIACILYLAETRRLFGINGVVTTLHVQKLRWYLAEDVGDWTDLGLLRVWCMAMGGMESEKSLRNWYSNEIHRSLPGLGLRNVEQLKQQLNNMLWLEDAHSPSFMSLCSGAEYIPEKLKQSPVRKWRPLGIHTF